MLGPASRYETQYRFAAETWAVGDGFWAQWQPSTNAWSIYKCGHRPGTIGDMNNTLARGLDLEQVTNLGYQLVDLESDRRTAQRRYFEADDKIVKAGNEAMSALERAAEVRADQAKEQLATGGGTPPEPHQPGVGGHTSTETGEEERE